MKTKIITNDIETAAAVIQEGGLCAVPTETVYGLAANGLDEAAVQKIYEVKGRPAVKPLSLMVPDADAFRKYGADVPPCAYTLAEAFWPGPLTIVVKAAPCVPKLVTAGGNTVGLRCPQQEQTQALLRACALPLAAPSANPSGAPSPKTAGEVLGYFEDKIDAVIDGGVCGLGRESTIVSLSGAGYQLLRAGALDISAIRHALMRSIKIVGVTGGSGTGKTTALDALRDLGALVIDADALYHELCASCKPMLDEIEALFPGVVVDGVLQRKKLGAIVFSSSEKLAALQSITDRYINDAIDERLAQHAAAGGRYAAVDAIDIIGTPLQAYFCATVGITAPVETRCERIMAREGISREYAMLRIGAQKPDAFFEQNCTVCIRNDGTKAQFADKCKKNFTDILEV